MAWLREAPNLWRISDLAQGGARRGATSGILEDGGRSKSGTTYRQSPLSSNAAQKNGWDDSPFWRI